MIIPPNCPADGSHALTFNASINAYANTAISGGGGGGGGVTSEVFMESGSSLTTALFNIFVGCRSSTASDKIVNIPAATGSLQIIIIADLLGTADTYSITPVPASGTIIGSPVITEEYGSLTLLDTTAGWVPV